VQMQAPVAVALDAPDIDVAAHWATLVTPYVSTVKIGLELYLRYGPAVVATVRGGSGVQVFLDLKLHDIPNTVAGAARAVAKLRPEILTVHAAGGADMIKAAVQAAPETLVAGVTLLTSIGDKDLADLGGTLLAYLAWKQDTAGQKLEPIDGLTPEQRFFVAYGQSWCENERDENKRLRATVDPHSPAKYRANGVVANMPEYREAFHCKAGQPMVRENSCRVW